MVARVDKKLSLREVTKENYLEFINRELNPLVEKIRLWTEAIGERLIDGEGSPEGVVTADKGALYLRTDGSVGTSVYYKSTDDSATGWFPLP